MRHHRRNAGPRRPCRIFARPARLLARCWAGERGHRALDPGRPVQGRPLRRLVLHRGRHHRDLLPAELPGGAAQAAEHEVLPERRRRPAGRIPGLQAVPAGRQPRLAAVERARRPGGPGHAADRRRRHRPRRRARAGRPARLQRPPDRAPAARRARRGPAGPGPGAAGPDRPPADRDQRAADGRRRVRGRVRQHQDVQRHRARGLRPLPDRAAQARGPRAARPPRRARCRCGCRSARRCSPTTCSATWPRPPCPGSRSGGTGPTGAPCACRTGTASWRCGPSRSTSPASCRLTDLRDLAIAISRCRRLLDLDADPVAVDDLLRADPVLAPLVAKAPGRRVPRTVDAAEFAVRVGARPAGLHGGGPDPRRPAGDRARRARSRTRRAASPTCSPTMAALAGLDPATLALPQARRATFAALTRALADGSIDLGVGSDWQQARAQLAALPGSRPVDRGDDRDARPRRPGRVRPG